MGKLVREEFYKIAGVKQHAEFEQYLKDILFKPDERQEFYKAMLRISTDVYVDSFRAYFEEYAAERKANQQDYTPDTVAHILAAITRNNLQDSNGWSGYDPTAGTGSLLIQKWKDDQLAENPLTTYAPHNYLYMAQEMADNAIPYLLHNLALRGMNCVVIHGDTLERTAKQVYFVQNDDDDFLGFSSINVMPHTDEVKEQFEISGWEEETIDHIESGLVKLWPTLAPMQKKALEINPDPIAGTYEKPSDHLQLKDIAAVERAKAKKVYPAGTIVIQMSATRGQIGLLKSSGRVGTQYACIQTSFTPGFVFYMLKVRAPRWFHRVQDGLNLKLKDIENIPVAITLATREEEYEQLSLF